MRLNFEGRDNVLILLCKGLRESGVRDARYFPKSRRRERSMLTVNISDQDLLMFISRMSVRGEM